MNSHPADEISLAHWRTELEGYHLDFLKRDLYAAIQVVLLTIPQAMAYALVANLPLSAGLMAAIFSSLVAALAGSSRFLIVGPVNAIAILMQAGTAEILYSYYREASGVEREMIAIQVMAQIAILSGLFQVIAAIFKLGRLTQFVSHSVVVGYLAGSAIAIVINQLFTFTGIEEMSGIHSLYEKFLYFITHIPHSEIGTLTFGLMSLICLLFLKRFGKNLPGAAIVIGLSIAAYTLIGLTPLREFVNKVEIVGLSAEKFEILPGFSAPSFNTGMINNILSIAFAIALLSIIETTCSAKSIAATSGYPISINQEIFAVGLGNLVSAFTGSMPVSVSNTRSSLNLSSGARTRLSVIFNVCFVALIVHFLGFLVNLIPLSTLSAILFMIAVTLVNFKQLLLCIKSTRADAFVLVATFFACIFFNLNTAFYIGVVISITFYLKKAALPKLEEYAIDENGKLKGLDLAKTFQQRPIRVIKVEGELFFGSADVFYTTLKSIAEDDETTKVIILQLKNARDFDGTSCLALLQLQEYLQKGGRFLIACGMSQEVWDVMSHSGVVEQLKKENLFLFDELKPQLFMKKALERAYELLREQVIPAKEKVALSEAPFEDLKNQTLTISN